MTIMWGKALAAAAGVALLTAAPGHAQTIRQLEQQIQQIQDNDQSQIQDLRQEIQELKAQQRRQAERTEAARAAAARAAAAVVNVPHVVETHGHEFGLESADGQNSIFFTGRIHFDTGAYFGYKAKNGSGDGKAPLALSDGDNLRRARIGLVGQFAGDWDYGLIYDFGGSNDASVASGVENAYIVYKGFAKHHEEFPLSVVFGAIDVPWTMDEATSSNDFMFMEHSSSQSIATSFGGADQRTALGFTSNNDRYWLGLFLTGPALAKGTKMYDTGTTPCATTTTNPIATTDDCNGPSMAFLARGTYQVYQDADSSIHLGVNFGDQFRARDASNLPNISLGDNPELKIDETKFLGTGNIQAGSGDVIGAEAAGAYENAFVQGEYFHYDVNQILGPSFGFDGGYVEASYSFGGRRHYKAGAGAYSGVIPEHPLSWSGMGWGALELAARYSVVDLNAGNPANCKASGTPDILAVCGGDQQTYAVGLNYYPNDNMRFMLDFEHADISVPGTSHTAAAASFNAIALRTQVNW
jgi:phosphate-selective porin OprO and OprP